MDRECALYLSTIPVQLDDSKDDVDRLTKNWNNLSDKLKESNLVLDLLNVLSGLESSFFTWSLNRFTDGYDVVINPLLNKDFDESIFEMCSDILDIRLYQNELLEFVNNNHRGFICQSLSEEILNVLEDLQQCVSKFHDRHLQSFLGVEKLFNYLKPARETLSLLSNVVTGYNSASLLYDKSNVGVLIMDHLEHCWRNEVGLKKELLQHLLNVCLESYFTLIKNYISYSSVNKSVCDFFIRYRDEEYLLDNYSKSSNTTRLTDNNNHDNNEQQYHHNEDILDYDNNHYLQLLFNDNNNMKLMLDKRYVPRAFKKLSVQVFGTGIYLRLMKKGLDFELIFRNLDDLVSDLDKLYKHVSYQFYEYLKNECRIYDKFKEYFNYYLFQESDYVSNVIEMYNDNSSSSNDSNSKEEYNRSVYLNDSSRFYFCYDNMKNLTDSLEYFKYYKNVKYNNDTSSNSRNSNRSNTNSNSNNYNNEEDYDENHDLQSLFNDNNLDYRNLVLCNDLDEASRLVFNDKMVYKYKLIFKLLFQLKYSDYWLSQITLYHVKTSKIAIDPELIPKFNLQLFTVSKMQLFIKELLQYFQVDVVSTNVSEFLSNNYDNFLSLYKKHEKLLDNLVKLMFLKDSEIMLVLERILLIIVKLGTELMKFINNYDCCLYYDDFLILNNNKCNNDNVLMDHNTNPLMNNNNDVDNTDDLDNLSNVDMFVNLTNFDTVNISTNYTRLERDTDNLNSLLSNTGYCKMVSLARNEFEKNLNQFKSLLSTSDFTLKDRLSL